MTRVYVSKIHFLYSNNIFLALVFETKHSGISQIVNKSIQAIRLSDLIHTQAKIKFTVLINTHPISATPTYEHRSTTTSTPLSLKTVILGELIFVKNKLEHTHNS